MDAPPCLSPAQQAELLAIARRAIGERVRGKPPSGAIAVDSILRAPGAAFVTLMRGARLRGCIGYVHPVSPLAETVAQCAAAAATDDPRFPPVTEEDLRHLGLEISVLSPLVSLPDPAQIQVGLHGLCISHKGHRGLLLPQVASERGWDAETFLRQTCLKAGLAQDEWQHGAEIQVFTVHHFTDGLSLEPAEPCS